MKMLKKSFDLWPSVFVRVLPWAMVHLFVQVFLTIGQQFLPQKESLMLFSWILLVFGVNLFFSIIGVIVVNQATFDCLNNKKTPLIKPLEENFKYVMIESLRAFLPVILRFCLFIIPGIIESIRLYWITYVVQFDERYKRGEIDALQESRNLIKGRFWKAAIILIFAGSLSMLPRLGSSATQTFSDTVILSGLIFVSVALEVLGDIVLYHFYWEQKNVTKV